MQPDTPCATAAYYAEVSGITYHGALKKLKNAWKQGTLDRYSFGTLVVYCRRGADPTIPLKTRRGRWIFLTPHDIMQTVAKTLEGYKSRRAVVKIKHICRKLDTEPETCTGVVASVLKAAGAEIIKTSDGIRAVINDVDKFRTSAGNATLTPDPPPRPPPRPTTRGRREEKMMQISIQLPPTWICQIDALIQEGRYRSRSAVVRKALSQLLEKYKTVLDAAPATRCWRNDRR